MYISKRLKKKWNMAGTFLVLINNLKTRSYDLFFLPLVLELVLLVVVAAAAARLLTTAIINIRGNSACALAITIITTTTTTLIAALHYGLHYK
jgi:hypothetical protein